MAKDPAFLFYSSDFLTGVQDLTLDERGQYITLLCLQHQKGALTEKIIKIAVGNATADVLAKFKRDDNGNYYNERLEIEREKRSSYSEKQSNRAKEGWKKRKLKQESLKATADATALPLENEDENRNKDVIEIVFPFDSKTFKNMWELWKDYRHKQHKFKYKHVVSEQAALKKLNNLCGGKEDVAIGSIEYTMSNGWKDFYLPKNDNNGKSRLETFAEASRSRDADALFKDT